MFKLNLRAAAAALFAKTEAPAPTPEAAVTATGGRFDPSGPRNGSAWDSAQQSPRRGQIPGPSPTDARQELPTYTRLAILRKARYHSKMSGLFKQVARDMRLYSIGDGIKAQAAGGDEAWNAKAQEIWDMFARSPDISGRFDLVQLQHILSTRLDYDGEHFALKVRDSYGLPKVQFLGTHRCWDGTEPLPRMVDGIQLDAFNKPLMYRFERDDGTFRDVPAPAVMHVYNAEEYDAARYVPAGHHGFDNLQDEREILSMEKHNVKEDARNPRTFKRAPKTPSAADQTEDEVAFGDKVRAGSAPEGTDPAAVAKVFGAETLFIEYQEELKSYKSERPNATFQGFLEWLFKSACAGGELPYEFVHDPSKIGGASTRLVVGKASRAFSDRQRVIISRFLQPLYSWVIADAIANGELAENPTFYLADWVVTRSVSVDAGRDRKADRDDLIFGNRTMTEDFAEQGDNFRTAARRRAGEMRYLKDLAEEFDIPLPMLWNPSPSSAQPPATDANDPKGEEPNDPGDGDGEDDETDPNEPNEPNEPSQAPKKQ